jgi:hypothetical protein
MYERFADDALCSINIANPITGALLMTYDFQFSPVSSAAGDLQEQADDSLLRARNSGRSHHYYRRSAAELHADVRSHGRKRNQFVEHAARIVLHGAASKHGIEHHAVL